VYDSVLYDGYSGWLQLGGTSAAAPAWAGLVAIADQGLATAGHRPLSTSELVTELYSLPSSDFHDIISGNNGYPATPGYDLVTGLGTPRANQLVAGLLAASSPRSAPTRTPTPTSTPASTPTPKSTPTPTPTSHHVKHKIHHPHHVEHKIHLSKNHGAITRPEWKLVRRYEG
jgi:subtilase family serine protease